MRYKREIRVAVLAIISLFLLYFGFNYLKGTNVFKSVNTYYGYYTHLDGLVEQAPVLVRGYKVGQVDAITYDFTRDSAFLVTISIHRDIRLVDGTQMVLAPNGLLGGMAIELQIPVTSAAGKVYADEDFLPTSVVPGLMEKMETELLGKVSKTVGDIDSLVLVVNEQLADNHVKAILANVDDLSANLKRIVRKDVPGIVNHMDSVLEHVEVFTANLQQVDIHGTIAKVDATVENVNGVVTTIRSDKGTIGRLLNDPGLYTHIDSTIVAVDSLVVDLKANPKRYVHFSLFAPRDKKKK